MRRLLAALALLTLSAQAQAQDCGPDAPCAVEAGDYHLRLPDGPGPHPVLIWYHGHRGSGASIHRDGGLARDFLAEGWALLAPNGVPLQGGGHSYPARTGAPRDDVAFTRAVLADAAARAPLDLETVVVTGFSAGGSMAWLMACEAGDRLAGMVSVAGALRDPNDTDCAGLAGLPVLQIHGFTDSTVPLEGRGIRDWHQGSVWDALDRARDANGCRSNPDATEIGAHFRTRDWSESCAGAPVRLALHDGGHGLPRGWSTMARDWLAAAGR